ncbi:MAG: transglutaminase domain-containing protein [Sedimentisphaerales bacterium]|nr:transglutaminase domain-containing protein [Sedimentisphaerales bacterium]
METNFLTTLILLAITATSTGSGSEFPELDDSTDIAFVLSYEITPQKKSPPGRENAVMKQIKFMINLPQTIERRQEITKLVTEPQPSRTFMENGNKYAEYDLPIPKEKIVIKIRIEAKVFRYDLAAAMKNQNPDSLSQAELKPFLKHERMIEKDDTVIQKISQTIDGGTELEIVKKIYKYVIRNLTIDASRAKGVGAAETARTKKGKCIDYCDLFVALCRAKNIPARVAAGYRTNFNMTPKHSWAEVYFSECGWVPFEVSGRNNNPEELLDWRFENLPPNYLYFTNLRNDPVLHNSYFYCYPFWDMNLIKVIKSIVEKIEFEKPIQKKHESIRLEKAKKDNPAEQ